MKRNSIRKLQFPFFLVLFALLLYFFDLPLSVEEVSVPVSSDFLQQNTEIIAETLESTVVESEPAFEEYDISLLMVGDNLMHMGLVNSGKLPDGSLNYDFLFEDIAPYLNSTDIKIINQETILGGNKLGFSGYPKFNSPTEIGDAIAKAGFNVVLHASNHAGDRDYKGLENCVNFWKEHPDVHMIGIQTEEENSIAYLDIKEKTFAILNYTYGPNLGTVPSPLRNHLNILCNYNEKTGVLDFTSIHPQVLEDIKTAKTKADIVIVCPHWGTEYTNVPSKYQEEFALAMTEAGADVIIGTHPHVVQPVEIIKAENGNSALCYYSLGNYVSTQRDHNCMLEGMAYVTFHVSEDDISISDNKTGVLPLVFQYTSGPTRFEGIYPLSEYTEELAGAHGIRAFTSPLTLSYLQEKASEVFGSYILTSSDLISQ